MRRVPNPILLLLAGGLLLSLAAPTVSATPALQYVPADREVVININMRGIMDSPLMTSLLDPAQPNRLTAGLQILAGISGVNPQKDLDNICLYGRIGHSDTVGVIAEGRFDHQRLLAQVQANSQYASFSIGNLTVHQWPDRHEKRIKYGAFITDGILGIWNSKPALEASLAAAGDAARPAADLANAPLSAAEREGCLVWGMMRKQPAGGYAADHGLNGAAYRLTSGEGYWVSRLKLLPASDDAALNWFDLLRGIIAYGQLQAKKPLFQELASAMQAKIAEGEQSVTLEARMSQDRLLELAQKCLGRK